MNTEFFTALELLEREKGIPQSYMMEKIEAALISAFKKEYGSNTNVRVHIDPAKKDVRVYQQKEVVEVVEDPATQISLEDAKKISKRNTIGKIVEFEVKTKNFRRLSAGSGKSVIIQGIREGERRVMQEAYENKHEEIITATVSKVDPVNGNVVLENDMETHGFGSRYIPSEEYPDTDGTIWYRVTFGGETAREQRVYYFNTKEIIGNKYGTPKEAVFRMLDEGFDVILEIEVKGFLQVKEAYPECVTIFIAPPSFEELQARLRGRGTETDEVIAERLKTAEQELQSSSLFDYVVVNDDVDRAADEVLSIIADRKANA